MKIQKGKEVRYHMIAEAAYYRAQQRGFIGGDPMGDWLAAEAEIDDKLVMILPFMRVNRQACRLEIS
jgi:hypothetical protein